MIIQMISATMTFYIERSVIFTAAIQISYTYNRNRCMVYYDRKYNLIAQGVMPSTENGVHVDPIIMQVGNGLIRIDLTSIQPHAVVPDKSVQARIIYYSPR